MIECFFWYDMYTKKEERTMRDEFRENIYLSGKTLLNQSLTEMYHNIMSG